MWSRLCGSGPREAKQSCPRSRARPVQPMVAQGAQLPSERPAHPDRAGRLLPSPGPSALPWAPTLSHGSCTSGSQSLSAAASRSTDTEVGLVVPSPALLPLPRLSSGRGEAVGRELAGVVQKQAQLPPASSSSLQCRGPRMPQAGPLCRWPHPCRGHTDPIPEQGWAVASGLEAALTLLPASFSSDQNTV